MLVGVASLPPSLIPSLQNIGILHHKKAKVPKHLQHSVCAIYCNESKYYKYYNMS